MSTAIGAQEIIPWTWSCPASAAIAKGAAIKHSTDASGTVAECSAITDAVDGVALNTAATGESVAIQSAGIAICIAKNAITEGDQVMPSTTAGKVSTAAGATATSMGKALQTVADGEKVAVLLAVPAVKRPPNA